MKIIKYPSNFLILNLFKLLFLLLILLLIFPFGSSYAGLYYQHSFHYNSATDDADNFSYTTMRNVLFIGATLGSSGKMILGQNIIKWNKTHKADSASNESSMDLLELGPRITYYFNNDRTWSAGLAYNIYAKGTRTLASTSTEEDISGTSIYLNFNYQLKINKNFYLGASLNYHSIAISESTTSGVESTVSHSYTYIYPAIEFSLRFK